MASAFLSAQGRAAAWTSARGRGPGPARWIVQTAYGADRQGRLSTCYHGQQSTLHPAASLYMTFGAADRIT